MKTLIMLTVVLMGFHANASVESANPAAAPFVPTECGAQTVPPAAPQGAHIKQICVGFVPGDQRDNVNNLAVQYRLEDGSTQDYKVLHTSSPLIYNESGEITNLYHMIGTSGEMETMKVTVKPHGEISSALGVHDSIGYFVPEFQHTGLAQ